VWWCGCHHLSACIPQESVSFLNDPHTRHLLLLIDLRQVYFWSPVRMLQFPYNFIPRKHHILQKCRTNARCQFSMAPRKFMVAPCIFDSSYSWFM
jgi:hypothetical protein